MKTKIEVEVDAHVVAACVNYFLDIQKRERSGDDMLMWEAVLSLFLADIVTQGFEFVADKDAPDYVGFLARMDQARAKAKDKLREITEE